MSTRYQIWDKKSQVITPIGEVLSAQEWADRYPMSKVEGIDLVIAGGTINGAFCGEYTSMCDMYDKQMKNSGLPEYEGGIPEGLTKQETLDFIEAFEDARNQPVEDPVPSADERIAAALEAQVMMELPDVD